MGANSEVIRVRLAPLDVERIDRIAEATGHSRSSLLRYLARMVEVEPLAPIRLPRIEPMDQLERVEPYREAVPERRGG
jgi:hypothetical protein